MKAKAEYTLHADSQKRPKTIENSATQTSKITGDYQNFVRDLYVL